jgi:hypothetical protein
MEGTDMTEILLIADETTDNRDHELIEEAAALHPDRVTIVIPGDNDRWDSDMSPEASSRRDRIAYLLARVADRTGAAVVGMVTSPSLADHGRFAAVIAPSVAAVA